MVCRPEGKLVREAENLGEILDGDDPLRGRYPRPRDTSKTASTCQETLMHRVSLPSRVSQTNSYLSLFFAHKNHSQNRTEAFLANKHLSTNDSQQDVCHCFQSDGESSTGG